MRPLDRDILMNDEREQEIVGRNFSTEETARAWIQPRLDQGYRLIDIKKISDQDGWTVAATR